MVNAIDPIDTALCCYILKNGVYDATHQVPFYTLTFELYVCLVDIREAFKIFRYQTSSCYYTTVPTVRR